VLLILGLAGLGCGGASDGEGSAAADSTAVAAENADEDAATENNEEEGEESDGPQRRERATTVNAARVTQGELVVPVIAEGSIRARRIT